MSGLQAVIDDVQNLMYDPARVQSRLLKHVEDVYSGKIDLVDPSNPFIHVHEAMAVTASALARREEVLLSKQYPVLAKTMDDLYMHMTDRDYIGRFGTPATLPFTLVLRRDEIISKAVRVGESAVRKLRIPRYTTFVVAGVNYTLLYPIEIRVMSHGGLRIVYDTTEVSPFQNVESNVVEWFINRIEGLEYVNITIPALQLAREEFNDTMNPATGFKKKYSYSDQFYYARVFSVSGNGNMTELAITYSEQVYDSRKPTALIRHDEGNITVEVPFIYFSNGSVGSKIHIDLYTTRGDIAIDYSEFDITAFSLRWGKELNAEESVYSAPLSTLNTISVYSTKRTVGGSNGIDFDSLKERIISRATTIGLPITDAQLKSTLNMKGYGIIKSIDDVMSRVYLATRSLPPPIQQTTDGQVEDDRSGLYTTGAACTIDTVQLAIDDIVRLNTVIDNGSRVTITPKTRYRYDNGIPKIITDAEHPDVITSSEEQLLALVNGNDYAYSPFYYVLDTSNNRFAVRGYHLDQPKLVSRTFIAENDTTQLNVSTRAISIELVDGRYRLIVASTVGQTYSEIPFEDLFLQLRFLPVNETSYAVVNGVFQGVVNDEYIWIFNLDTRYDIDLNDRLGLTNFTMFDLEPRTFTVNLTHTFELIYGVYNYSVVGYQRHEIDNYLGRWLLDLDAEPVAISQERMVLQLGESLRYLWSNARTIAGSRIPLRYEEDVPLTYTETVYETDPDTGVIALSVVDGELRYNVIHRKGDVVVRNGEIEYKHRKGEVVIDPSTMEPVYIQSRTTQRLIDLFLVDGVYAYSTNRFDIRYRDSIARTVVDYVNIDLAILTKDLLENTFLYFYPKRTLGFTKALIGGGLESTFDARLSFSVRYYLTKENYGNMDLRRNITDTTSRVINRLLQRNTVSTELLSKQLRAEIGEDVVSIELLPFNVAGGISTYTSLDDSTRCSVKRILRSLPNGERIINEDITIEWIRHK